VSDNGDNPDRVPEPAVRAVREQMRALRTAGAGGDPARPETLALRGRGLPPPVGLVAIAALLDRLCAADAAADDRDAAGARTRANEEGDTP